LQRLSGKFGLETGRLGSFRFKLVAWFALLALLPLAVAFYGYDGLAQRSESRRADASLEAVLRVAIDGYGKRLDAADMAAQRLAGEMEVQRALRHGDQAELAAIVADHPSTILVAGDVHAGRVPDLAAVRSIDVLDRGHRLGSVAVVVPIDDALLREIGVGLDSGDRLVAVVDGRIVAGAPSEALQLRPGRSGRVEVDGIESRALATSPLVDPAGLQLVALTPQRAIDVAARSAEMRLAAVLLGSLLVFSLVIFLLGRSVVTTLRRLADAADGIADGRLDERVEVRGHDEFAQLGGAFNRMATQLQQQVSELRTERRRSHEATARLGQALGATHDPTQLLQVVAQTAVEATGASGAVVRTRTGEVLEAGEPGSPEVTFPLRSRKSDFGSLVLSGSKLDADQIETARALASQAAVALENARLHRLVERQALVDGLTGLANRRSLDETLGTELARAGRLGHELCLVLADLDHFKRVNDEHGHLAGDDVLRAFAQTLAETVRETDVAGRWGGEEFALVLVGVGVAGGVELAERARRAIAARIIDTGAGPLRVTASFGVAACTGGATIEELTAAADEALYEAKNGGRDQVVGGASVGPVV
jgi:diguanylate cyclase (GGDEF)-like protein